jgi:hypothetical protein
MEASKVFEASRANTARDARQRVQGYRALGQGGTALLEPTMRAARFGGALGRE